MRITHICLFLFLSATFAWTQDVSWSSNRPQNTLIEGCGPGEFILTNEGNSSIELTIELNGNYDEADIETDVLSSVNIQAGNSYTFTIEAIADDEAETDENVVITVRAGDQVLREVELSLQDELVLETPTDEDFSECPDGGVLLTATSNANITWMPGNIVSDSFRLFFQEETDVILSASQGSCMETIEFTVSPEVSVQIDYPDDTLFLCLGEEPTRVTATLTNTDDVNWESRGFQFGQGPNNSIEIDPETSGWLYATVSSGTCTVTDTLYVQVDSLPEIMFDTIPNKDPYCPGEIVTIYGMQLQQDLFPAATYEWGQEAGIISDLKKANLTLTTTDTIAFIRTTTNNACVSTDTVVLNVDNPPVELNLTDTVICPNQTVELELLNPELFESYEWAPEDKVSCTECVRTRVTVAEPTTIMLNLETEHCPTSASVNINIEAPQQIEIVGEGPVCPGEEVQLTALDVDQYESFSWDGGLSFSCDDCPNPTVSSGEVNVASLVAVDEDGCLGVGNFVYEVFQTPEVSIGINPNVVAQGETVTASLLTNQTENFMDIVWEVNGEISSETGMMANLVMDSENNTIVVTALTADGCPVSAILDVSADPPSYTIPNAFTPNGQTNNVFRVITNGNITVERMRIFSRWSQLIFTDESGEGWDGTQNGKRLPSDTYVYIVELILPNGQRIEETSEVTLIN